MSEYDHEYTGTLPVIPVADVAASLQFFVERLGCHGGPPGRPIGLAGSSLEGISSRFRFVVMPAST